MTTYFILQMERKYEKTAFTNSKQDQINGTDINPLTPNDPYSGRTAPLTSKRCILYIYSTNIGTEYFKRFGAGIIFLILAHPVYKM